MEILNKIKNIVKVQDISPGIWAALGIQAIRSTGYSISFTYLSLYLYQQRHIAMTLVGTVILISGIVSGAFQVLGGMLADRFGHRRMFVIFELAEIVMFGLFAVLVGTNANIWLIFVTSTIVSILGGMCGPTISAMVMDASHESRLTESYGLMSIGGNSGWVIGPIIGGFLLHHISYAWVFGIGALVHALSLIGIRYLPSHGKGETSKLLSRSYLKLFLSNRVMLVFCVLCLFFFLEMANWGATLSVFSVDRLRFSTEQYGLLLSVSALSIIIFQYPISRRINWLGTRKALFLGSLLYAVGFMSLSWVKSFAVAIIPITVATIGEMLFVPTSFSAMGKMSRPEDVAKNMGILGLYITVGNSFGPLLGGFLLDRFPTNAFFVWGSLSIPAFLAAIGFLFWRGYSKAKVSQEIGKLGSTQS
ncbi:MAG: MFS transporter [Dehalococcoidales bacterium]|nr:MFS transporter [Dehalococcoidales bacterium]